MVRLGKSSSVQRLELLNPKKARGPGCRPWIAVGVHGEKHRSPFRIEREKGQAPFVRKKLRPECKATNSRQEEDDLEMIAEKL